MQQQRYTNVHIQRIYSVTGLPHDRDRITQNVFALLHDISIAELETLIVCTCQMAGELVRTTTTEDDTEENPSSTSTPQKTFVPLRLATIEIGDMFVVTKEKDPTNAKIELRRLSQDEKYSDEADGIMAVILANIFDYNSQYPHHPIFMEEEYIKYKEHFENGGKKSSPKSKQSGHDDGDDEDYEEEYEEDEYGEDEGDKTKTFIYPPRSMMIAQ